MAFCASLPEGRREQAPSSSHLPKHKQQTRLEHIMRVTRPGRRRGSGGGGALVMEFVATLCIAMAGSIEAAWQVFPDSTPGSLDLFAPLTGERCHSQDLCLWPRGPFGSNLSLFLPFKAPLLSLALFSFPSSLSGLLHPLPSPSSLPCFAMPAASLILVLHCHLLPHSSLVRSP